MKTGWWIAGGAGLLLAGGYLWRLNRTQKNLNPIVRVNFHKFSLTGITFRIDITVKNPTKTALKFMFPFITLLYNGTLIGSSQVVNKIVEVPGYGEASIDAIMVDIPYTTLLLKMPEVYKAIQEKKPVSIKAKIQSTVKLAFGDYPWERIDTINLMNSNANG